ncbi:MAG TPA: LEPR-XLL domain-containing protein, partial [Phycisphaerae bacterium]|nr:LEPR-XLL domain-containing protein [Phycisphaerae bacterium]
MNTSPCRSVFETLEPRLLLDGAPHLPGLYLVEPDNTRLDGQVVVLDFDGAEDVEYRGPVAVNGIDVPAFRAPGDLAGQEQAVIGRVISELNSLFAEAQVTFVIDRPQGDTAYSTIFVGGDDSRFAAYGS